MAPRREGLWAWIGRGLASVQPASHPDPRVLRAITGLFGNAGSALPAPAIAACAEWAQCRYVDRTMQNQAPINWQWPLAVLTWLMQRAGIVGLWREDALVS